MKNCKSNGQELPEFDIEKYRGKPCYVWDGEKPEEFTDDDIRILSDYLPSACNRFITYSDGKNMESAKFVTSWKHCEMVEENEDD